MTINLLDLEVVLDYTVQTTGGVKTIHWKSIKACSQADDGKLCDMVNILPILHHNQIEEIEEKS
jgi:hypothetical protein